jgi:hypothetical protein
MHGLHGFLSSQFVERNICYAFCKAVIFFSVKIGEILIDFSFFEKEFFGG